MEKDYTLGGLVGGWTTQLKNNMRSQIGSLFPFCTAKNKIIMETTT